MQIQVAGGFHTLALFDDIHLEVHPGPENPGQENPGHGSPGQENPGHGNPGQDNRLIPQGGKNLLDKIDIRLQDSVVSIRNRNRCNWMRDLEQKLTLRLHTGSVRNIQYSGSGDVVFADTLFQDHFTLEVWDGYGQVSPLIRVREASFKLHSGTATLTPAGNLYFLGHPSVCLIEHTGSGGLYPFP